MEITDWEKVQETLKPWKEAIQKKIELDADNKAKQRHWANAGAGLAKHFREEHISKEWRWHSSEEDELEGGIRICWRLGIKFTVTGEGLFVTEENKSKLPEVESVRLKVLEIENQEKDLRQLIDYLKHAKDAQPYFENNPDFPDSKRFFDIIIILEGKEYKNKEIDNLLDEKEEELKKLKFESQIQYSLFKLADEGKIARD